MDLLCKKYPVAECPNPACRDNTGEYMAGYCDACGYHKYSPKCPCHKCKALRTTKSS